jgi:site-specific DNA recombinase
MENRKGTFVTKGRAAVYARYSSDLQRDASIKDQVRACRARIDAESWELVATYTDHGVSGATPLRPGYQKLLEGARAGALDVVMAEALDRLSRDQEDVAALYKHLSFAGVRLITLAEGEISELHVGLKGTMNALFLKDLAQKTRRGLEGRVRQGRSGGGLCYGYKVTGDLDTRAQAERGCRRIDEGEAAVVRRILARVRRRQEPARNRPGTERRWGPGPGRPALGRHHHPRPRPARHRHPPQRALCWPHGLEPAALCEGPAHRQAAVAPQSA